MRRLGTFSQDVAIDGSFVTNKNGVLFLDFLKCTGIQYVNGFFARGVTTYELIGKKQSIIDVCLTNCITEVKSVAVLPHILGDNPQT